MPQIFDKIGRNTIRELMLEKGFQLIKQYGLKKTSVSDIAKNCGIATGTFYNFFQSKEEFVYQIVLHKRNIMKQKFEDKLVNGKMDQEGFHDYLSDMFLSDINLFDYINEEEIAALNARWPDEYWKNDKNDEMTSTWILGNLSGVRKDCDWIVFANLCKAISLIRFGRARLHQEKYEESLQIYIDAIVRYVFQSK